MKHGKYPQRDPIKNYFPLPNEIFVFGLNSCEISVYSYPQGVEELRSMAQEGASYAQYMLDKLAPYGARGSP